MAHTNAGVITAPVSLHEDVKAVLQSGSNDLATNCKYSSVNFWARFKPTIGGRIQDRKINSISGQSEKYSVLYGLAYYNNSGQLRGKTNIIPKLTTSNFGSPIEWNLSIDWNGNQSSQNFYRLQDFNGYKHNAVLPVSNYSFVPSITVGGQSGRFYNTTMPIFTFTSLKKSYTGIPLPAYDSTGVKMCWEDVSGHNIDSGYGQLFLEDLMRASNIDGRDIDFNIGDMYVGVIFRIGTYYVTLNPFITFNNILNSSASGTKKLIAFKQNTDAKIEIGTMFYGESEFSIFVNIFNLYKKVVGLPSSIFNENATRIYSRAILTTNSASYIPSGMTPSNNEIFCSVYYGDNTITDGIYSLQLTRDFANNNVDYKKLLYYVNVTSYTNRTNNTVRNAGRWYDSTVNTVGNETVDFQYINGNWSSTVGHPPSKIYQKCKLDADVSYKYLIDSTTGKMRRANTGESGIYVRYGLLIRGFVCCEFRGKDGSTYNNNYYLPEDGVDIYKYAEIRMKKSSGSSNFFLMTIGNDMTPIEVLSDGIRVGEYRSFWWNKFNINQPNPLRYCDKNYGSSSADINKCYSDVIQLNKLVDFNNVDTYYYDGVNEYKVYIYVLRTEFSTPNSLKFKFEYSFGPDLNDDYEVMDVVDDGGYSDFYDTTHNSWNNI